MLADARHVVAADPSTRAGKWEKKKFMGREISRQDRRASSGLGYIGQTLVTPAARIRRGACSATTRCSPRTARADMDVELVDLPELFARSDYVTLHVPENDETRGMVNAGPARRDEARRHHRQLRPGRHRERGRPARGLKAAQGHPLPERRVSRRTAEGEKSVADIADLMLPHLGASTVEANRNAARARGRAADRVRREGHHQLHRQPRHPRRSGRGLRRAGLHAGRALPQRGGRQDAS